MASLVSSDRITCWMVIDRFVLQLRARDPNSRWDRYMLLTFEEPPANVKVRRSRPSSSRRVAPRVWRGWTVDFTNRRPFCLPFCSWFEDGIIMRHLCIEWWMKVGGLIFVVLLVRSECCGRECCERVSVRLHDLRTFFTVTCKLVISPLSLFQKSLPFVN